MKIRTNFWLLCLGVLALASCSGERDLLETIPADSKLVAEINVTELLNQMDIKIDGHDLKLPSYMGNVPIPEDAVKTIVLANEAIDGDHVMVVMSDLKKNNAYCTASIKDLEAWEKALKESDAPKIKEVEDYKGFEANGSAVIYNDHQMWIGEGTQKELAKLVDKELKKADKESIEKLEGIKNAFAANKLLTMAIPAKTLADNGIVSLTNDMKDAWGVMSIYIQNNQVLMEGSGMKGDGREVEMPGSTPITNAVLNYVPQQAALVVAMGIGPNYPWDNLTSALELGAGRDAAAMGGTILPYLKSIDGTVMFSATPRSAESYYTGMNNFLDNWNVLFMAHMPQSSINDITDMANTWLTAAGLPVEYGDDNMTYTAIDGTPVMYGNLDGYFTFANYPVQAGQQNQLAPIFDGTVAAGYFNLPNCQMASPYAPDFGIKAEMRVQKTKFTLKVIFTGISGKLIPGLVQKYSSRPTPSYGLNDYDYDADAVAYDLSADSTEYL